MEKNLFLPNQFIPVLEISATQFHHRQQNYNQNKLVIIIIDNRNI